MEAVLVYKLKSPKFTEMPNEVSLQKVLLCCIVLQPCDPLDLFLILAS